jgi:hypothetical protein
MFPNTVYYIKLSLHFFLIMLGNAGLILDLRQWTDPDAGMPMPDLTQLTALFQAFRHLL